MTTQSPDDQNGDPFDPSVASELAPLSRIEVPDTWPTIAAENGSVTQIGQRRMWPAMAIAAAAVVIAAFGFGALSRESTDQTVIAHSDEASPDSYSVADCDAEPLGAVLASLWTDELMAQSDEQGPYPDGVLLARRLVGMELIESDDGVRRLTLVLSSGANADGVSELVLDARPGLDDAIDRLDRTSVDGSMIVLALVPAGVNGSVELTLPHVMVACGVDGLAYGDPGLDEQELGTMADGLAGVVASVLGLAVDIDPSIPFEPTAS